MMREVVCTTPLIRVLMIMFAIGWAVILILYGWTKADWSSLRRT